jgi:hypothetical protein
MIRLFVRELDMGGDNSIINHYAQNDSVIRGMMNGDRRCPGNAFESHEKVGHLGSFKLVRGDLQIDKEDMNGLRAYC